MVEDYNSLYGEGQQIILKYIYSFVEQWSARQSVTLEIAGSSPVEAAKVDWRTFKSLIAMIKVVYLFLVMWHNKDTLETIKQVPRSVINRPKKGVASSCV